MGIFVRAVVTGFGFSLGSALFKRYQSRLGFPEDKQEVKPVPTPDDGDDIDDLTGSTDNS